LLSPLYPAKVIGMFVAIMIIAIAGLREHHPYPRFGAANVATTIRALLVATVAGFIGEAPLRAFAATAALLAGVATLLDGVDGWLARRTEMVSTFGARFDMEIDALLIQTLAILVWQEGKAGVWVLASGLIRYLFVAAGRVWPWLRGPLMATLRGRLICVIQLIALIAAILPPVQPPSSSWIAAAGLGVLCYSFFVDTLRLWRQR
jgi:phosphatidylglycerophosphate synthase